MEKRYISIQLYCLIFLLVHNYLTRNDRSEIQRGAAGETLISIGTGSQGCYLPRIMLSVVQRWMLKHDTQIWQTIKTMIWQRWQFKYWFLCFICQMCNAICINDKVICCSLISCASDHQHTDSFVVASFH